MYIFPNLTEYNDTVSNFKQKDGKTQSGIEQKQLFSVPLDKYFFLAAKHFIEFRHLN